ncbi:MAG: tape measure protein [Desulfobulbus sp.]|nr:tape measure protein [Desulfobulbus sp.]
MRANSKIEIILTAKDNGLSAALKRGGAQVSSFAGTVRNATKPINSMVNAALSLKTAVAGIVTGAGLSVVANSLLNAGQKADSLRLSFQSINGTGQNAAKELEFVRLTADKLGLDLETAAQAYKGISAAAQGTTLAGRGVQQIFTSVSKASTVLGLSADETSGALLAISQMISKGKVSAEELRGQLGERLPGAFQIAAQAMGMTTGELDTMMASGNLLATDFLPKFAVALEQRFGGAAQNAANSFGAASNRIKSELFQLKSALGQAVTNNTFFVTALGKASSMLKTLSTDASKNAASWRQWAKESALSVLGFVADTSDGFNDVYKSLSWLSGSLKLAYGGALTLGKGFQWLFEQANRLTGDTEKANYWAQAQVEATAMIEQAMAGAAKSFDNAERGSTTLTKVTTRLQELKKELAQVKADEVNPVEGVAEQAEVEFKEVEGRWIAVEKKIKESNSDTSKQVNVDWGQVWTDFEKNGLSAADAVDSALDKAARTRTATIKVDTEQARMWGGLIGAYRNGGLLLQHLASGGGVRNILSGGQLPGFGGGDRRLLLGEDGEVMLNKYAVRAGGLKAALAFNSGRFDIVLQELSRRFGQVGYRLGGFIGSLPALPAQHLVAGGSVNSGGGNDLGTLNLSFPSGSSVPVLTTREQARLLIREFERMKWRASS